MEQIENVTTITPCPCRSFNHYVIEAFQKISFVHHFVRIRYIHVGPGPLTDCTMFVFTTWTYAVWNKRINDEFFFRSVFPSVRWYKHQIHKRGPEPSTPLEAEENRIINIYCNLTWNVCIHFISCQSHNFRHIMPLHMTPQKNNNKDLLAVRSTRTPTMMMSLGYFC